MPASSSTSFASSRLRPTTSGTPLRIGGRRSSRHPPSRSTATRSRIALLTVIAILLYLSARCDPTTSGQAPIGFQGTLGSRQGAAAVPSNPMAAPHEHPAEDIARTPARAHRQGGGSRLVLRGDRGAGRRAASGARAFAARARGAERWLPHGTGVTMIDSRTSLHGSSGRAGGVLVYGITALLWTAYLGFFVGYLSSRGWLGVLWAICAATLWFVSLRDREPPLVKTAFVWWLRSLVGPAVVLLELIEGRGRLDALQEDVDRLKRQMRALQESGVTPRAPAPEPAPATVPPPPKAAPAPPPPPPQPAPARAAAPTTPTPTLRPLPGQKREPAFDWRNQLEAADLLGAKALAWAGGIVTLLGVVFFFVLAANRGWVGPGLRIACGATA